MGRPATGDNTRDRKPTALVSAKAPATAAADGPTVMIVAEPEVFELSSAAKPILATGFHSGVGTVVKDLFDWTDSGACGGAGDPKLSPVDESTIAPGLFLAGPQVVHDDAVFCFVYKYRQRFAVITDQIAVRLGLDTTKAVA